MPDEAAEILGQQPAISHLDHDISDRWPGSQRLDADVLKAHFPARRLVAGWVLPHQALAFGQDLWLLCDDLYPFSLPIVATPNSKPETTHPHVEIDGVVCLTDGAVLADLPADIRHAVDQVNAAKDALDAGNRQANRDDFLDEFGSYWTRGEPERRAVHLLLDDHTAARQFVVATAGNVRIVAEDRDQADRWLTNAGYDVTKPRIGKGVFARLAQPIYPEQYPRQVRDLFELLQSLAPQALPVIAETIHPGNECTVVLSVPGPRGENIGTVQFDVPRRIPIGHDSMVPIDRGFRPGAIPKLQLLQRVAQLRSPVERRSAMRVDRRSLLVRSAGRVSSALASARISIIGCGVLGAQVAVFLAQAGIGRFILIDSDRMDWANSGRHVLPGRESGLNKADALRHHLLERFPEADIMAKPEKWQALWRDDPSFLDTTDLIVSATGSWLSERLLNELVRSPSGFPPAVFAWIEPYALAGHSVYVTDTGGCLQCLTDRIGAVREPVVVVSGDYGRRRENSCGAFYQPFSMLDAAPVATMTARLALDAIEGRTGWSEHRIWTAAQSEFDRYRAPIADVWLSRLRRDGFERVLRDPMSQHAECSLCRRR